MAAVLAGEVLVSLCALVYRLRVGMGPPARDRIEGREARDDLLLVGVRHVCGAPLSEQHGAVPLCFVGRGPTGHFLRHRGLLVSLASSLGQQGGGSGSRPRSLGCAIDSVGYGRASRIVYSTVPVVEAWFYPLSVA